MRNDIFAFAIAVFAVQGIFCFQATVLIPAIGRIIEGGNVTFTCKSEGEGNSTYSLWKTSVVQTYFVLAANGTDGQCMTENMPIGLYPYCSINTFNLTISPVVNSMHHSRWICSQMFMDSNASNIFVEVPVKNVKMGLISGETKGEIACVENETLVMKCNTSFGRPQPSIIWYIGDSYTNASNIISINSKLLNYNESDNAYNYTVSVLTFTVSRSFYRQLIFCNSTNLQNVPPVSSNYAMLNVQYPPAIGEIQNISVIESKTVSISYPVIQGNPSETLFTLRREFDNRIWRNNTLLIDGVSRKDAGFYIFTANNTMKCSNGSYVHGYSSKRMYLEVLYPPVDLRVACLTDNSWNEIIPVVFDITEGTNITLACSAHSVPSPSAYSWSGISKVANANLTMYVTKNHSGDFICTASNVMNETNGNIGIGTTSKLYRMNVLYAPEVTKMQNITAFDGEDFVLNCSVIFGNPSGTTFRWMRNADSRTWDSQTLTINNITRYDSQTYTCLANNTLRPTYGPQTIGLSSQSVKIDILYFSTHGPVSRIPYNPTVTTVPPETANSFAIALPAVGGTVGGVLVIAIVVAVVTIIRRRKGSRTPESPNHQNTNNSSQNDDYAVPFDGACSNVYEQLHARGCDPQYQHLSTFAGAGIQKKDKVNESRLKGNIEGSQGGRLARHCPTSSPVTRRQKESRF